jgi:hypothetical protein
MLVRTEGTPRTSGSHPVTNLPTGAHVDAQAVGDALAEYQAANRSPPLHSVVDSATLPRLYAPFALTPTASGRDSLLAVPLT